MRFVRESLKLIRALAGNDTVKQNILKDDAARLIVDVVNLHKVTLFKHKLPILIYTCISMCLK